MLFDRVVRVVWFVRVVRVVWFVRVVCRTLGADAVVWFVCVVCRTLGADTVVFRTLGGVIGVSMVDVVRVLDFPTLAPMTPVERSFPIFWMLWSISVPGVPGGKDGPPGCGALIVSLISARRRLRRSKADVSGRSQQWGKNSNVLEIRVLCVLVMWHL